MNKLIISSLLCLFLFTACEEQMVMIPERTGTDSNRKILIEEFTGANCSACPQGAAAINDFISIYGENVVAVSIHSYAAQGLGEPYPQAAYDLRTLYGDAIAEHLAPLSSIPAAAINRKLFPGQPRLIVSPFEAWNSLVEDEIDTEPEVDISTTVDYDPITRKLNVSAKIVPQVDVTGDIRIVCYITESHIIDWQLNGTEDVEHYENNHVLRDVLTSVEGADLSNSLKAGTPIDYAFDTFELPAEDNGLWMEENCHVIVFVTKIDLDNGTREVLQADEADIME